MDLEIRPNTWEEFPTLKRVNARAQNNFYVESDIQRFGIIFEPERSLCAFEEGQIVGCTTSYSLEMMVPGGTVPIGAVAQVSVQATHRRRGINTKLMRRQLTDMHEWGDSLAVLQASESVIYGRYGYGMGSFEYTFELERPHGAFSRRYEPQGRMLFIEEDEAREVFPQVFERATLLRNGMVKRNDTWWKFRFVQGAMRGADPRAWFVKYEVDGRPDGYVWFTIKEAHLMTVRELVTATDDAYAALWQFCFDMDLVIEGDRRRAGGRRAASLADGGPPTAEADVQGRIVVQTDRRPGGAVGPDILRQRRPGTAGVGPVPGVERRQGEARRRAGGGGMPGHRSGAGPDPVGSRSGSGLPGRRQVPHAAQRGEGGGEYARCAESRGRDVRHRPYAVVHRQLVAG